MASGPKAQQSVERITFGTIYEKHAGPEISDRLPNVGKLGSKVQRAVSQQDLNGDP